MSGWKVAVLGDYINVKHGFAFSGQGITKEQTNDILVTPGNFYIGGGFKSDKFKYFHGEYPDSYILKEDDLVVPYAGFLKNCKFKILSLTKQNILQFCKYFVF